MSSLVWRPSARRLQAAATAACLLAGPCLLAASPAAGQPIGLDPSSFPPGSKLVAQRDLSVQISGQVTVQFHGDTAAGCARLGVCGYAGTVVFTPAGRGDGSVYALRHGGRISYTASFGAYGPGLAPTRARVTRGSSVCADAVPSEPFGDVSAAGGQVRVALLGDSASLRTRCAGPLDSDLAAAAPAQTFAGLAALRRGMTIDLRGTRSFSAGGFAGTLSSTVQMRVLGAANVTVGSGGGFRGGSGIPPGTRVTRVRTVTETLRVVRSAGTGTATFQGTRDPAVCSLLDACGAAGQVTWSLPGEGASAELTATGPARLPYRAFLAALGLRRGAVRARITVVGAVLFLGRGPESERFTQQATCADAGEVRLQYVSLFAFRRTLAAEYEAPIPRNRCPGPLLAPGLGGEMPRSVLSRPSFTVRLTRGLPFSDDGYAGHTSTTLRVTLARGHVTQRIDIEPVGA